MNEMSDMSSWDYLTLAVALGDYCDLSGCTYKAAI